MSSGGGREWKEGMGESSAFCILPGSIQEAAGGGSGAKKPFTVGLDGFSGKF